MAAIAANYFDASSISSTFAIHTTSGARAWKVNRIMRACRKIINFPMAYLSSMAISWRHVAIRDIRSIRPMLLENFSGLRSFDVDRNVLQGIFASPRSTLPYPNEDLRRAEEGLVHDQVEWAWTILIFLQPFSAMMRPPEKHTTTVTIIINVPPENAALFLDLAVMICRRRTTADVRRFTHLDANLSCVVAKPPIAIIPLSSTPLSSSTMSHLHFITPVFRRF